MNRTINERKAWRNIIIYSFINLFSLAGFAASVKAGSIIPGALTIMSYIISLFLAIYNGYSLGWEYKRLQMMEEYSQ